MAGLPAAKTFYADHMGLIHGSAELSNLSRPRAVHLCIPEHIAIWLQLRELEQRVVILADGHRRTALGNQVLLGAIPMDDMDSRASGVRSPWWDRNVVACSTTAGLSSCHSKSLRAKKPSKRSKLD